MAPAREGGVLPRVEPGFAPEIFAARGHAVQALQYLSLLEGDKPLLDDWIAPRALPDFERACARYGLKVRRGAAFFCVPRSSVAADVSEGARLTTTVAYGAPSDAPGLGREPAARVHVFVSRRRELLRHGMWYPLIVRGRAILPPYADVLRYGETLGYPDCCVRFFRRRNDWSKGSFLFDVYRSAPPPFHILCNSLLKDALPSYAYHMPCSYRCAATLRAGRRLRARWRRLAPGACRRLDEALRGPFLVLYERQAWAFRGRLRAGRLFYRAFERIPPAEPFPELERALASGDELRLEGRLLQVRSAGRPAARVRVPLTAFAPRLMHLAEFSDG